MRTGCLRITASSVRDRPRTRTTVAADIVTLIVAPDLEGRETLSTTTLSVPIGETVASGPPSRRGFSALALLVGVIGIALAVALPLAPVMSDRTTVSWPQQGAQPASTTAFFVPYRPAELHAEVPCTAVQAALGAGSRTTVLATTVVPEAGPALGLVIDTEGGRMRVLLNGRQVSTTDPAASGCAVRVDSDDTGTTVRTGAAATRLPDEPVPEVFAFSTDLTPEQAAGSRVTARTRTWFESAPTATKTAMMAAYGILALVAFGLLAGGATRRRARPVAPEAAAAAAPGRRTVRALVDAAVVAALSVWMVIGPQTDDDGYATMTIRNGLSSGDIGNYYHWFNASEAPFTLVQHLVQPLTTLSLAPLWLRLPSYLVGVAAWFVITRGVLGAALPALARASAVRALAALCFLAWWLPYNMSVRPEPFVALAVAAVLALLLRGTAPAARKGLLQVGAAALVAGISLSVTPSGVVVFAPILVLLPRVWRALTAAGGDGGRVTRRGVSGRIALLGCLASSGLVVMFADQTWHGVGKATELHSDIGPTLAWHEELVRYGLLLGGGSAGTATKRLPVLLTIALMLTAAVLIVRRARETGGVRDAHIVTACMAAGFALLLLTPSKWSHHFGSLAGLGAPFLVVAVVLVLQTAKRRSGDRAIVVAGLTGGGLTVLAIALSFSGMNAWYLYSNLAMPWSTIPISPLGVPLGNPVLWVLLGVAVVGSAAVGARSRDTDCRVAASTAVAASSAVLATVALATSIGVLAVSFTVAPLRQAEAGSYSLAAENLAHVTGSSCGIADKVQVLPDVPGGPLRPAEPGGSLDGFVRDDGYLPAESPGDAPGTGSATFLWGSLVGGELGTGALTSPWFGLPPLSRGQEVAVSVAGRTGGANRLALEFGRSDRTGVQTVTQRVLDDGASGFPEWRMLAEPVRAIPAGADRVRVRAVDGSTDVGGWLAVTGPRLRETVPLTQFVAGRGPVLVDWPMSWAVPCIRDMPRVTDGLAQAPRVLLAVQPAYAWVAGIAYDPGQGGSFAGTVVTATGREVPSRLVGSPGEPWGRVVLLDYDISRDAYERKTTQVRQWGWEGEL